MTGPICSITGEACQCAAGGGCATKRKNARALRVAEQGLEGVRLTVQEVERGLNLKRPYPGPELRELQRILSAARVEMNRIARNLEA